MPDSAPISFTATEENYANDKLPPGEYTITLTGTLFESDEEASTEFTWTLIDPCNPPESIALEPMEPLEYTITGDPLMVEFPKQLIVTPEFCSAAIHGYDYEVEPAEFTDAIWFHPGDDMLFINYPDLDLLVDPDAVDEDAPALEYKEVTLTLKVLIGKGVDDFFVVEVETTLLFRNPCFNSGYYTPIAT